MGREVREHLFDRVADLFHDLDMGMQPISVVFPYLPIAAHRKRDQSRAELAKIFTKIIRARKDSGKSEPDVLQARAPRCAARLLVACSDVALTWPRARRSSTRATRTGAR
jgi:cytochrome P450